MLHPHIVCGCTIFFLVTITVTVKGKSKFSFDNKLNRNETMRLRETERSCAVARCKSSSTNTPRETRLNWLWDTTSGYFDVTFLRYGQLFNWTSLTHSLRWFNFNIHLSCWRRARGQNQLPFRRCRRSCDTL